MQKSQVTSLRSRSSSIARTMCLLVLGVLWLAAPSFAATDRVIYVKNLTLWGADSNGANQQQISEPGSENRIYTADLSPNGQTIVANGCCGKTYLFDFNTHVRTVLYAETANAGREPKFSPDGKKVIFSVGSSAEGLDIATINTDGTGFKKIITWKGEQNSPDFSPDGTKIAFESKTESKGKSLTGGDQIFVANADGTSPVQVTKNSGNIISGSQEPAFSPNGSLLTFTGQTKTGPQIYTVSTSGTNQTQITTNEGGASDWSPDGSLLLFGTSRNKANGYDLYTVNSTGGNEQPFITSPTDNLEAGWYRHPSTTVHFFDYLAAKFRPVLRFDNSETWRPLNIESFLGEKQHHLCEGEACESTALTSAADLNHKRTTGAYIKIAGTKPNAETYHSPYSECTVNGLRDCDTGPKSAIYYRSPGIYGGYEYIDYWYFYRANYFLENLDFHDGDWEGATVAPSLEGPSFDYAAFSQHGTFYSYLRNVLRCEDTPASGLPERGTCSSTSARIDDLVANGDHANYTTPCKEELPTSCQQNGEGHFEAGYDGSKRWGNAYADPTTSSLPMPLMGSNSWTDWPGKWGSPASGPEEGSGPPSPGNQSFKIACATIDNEPGCTTGPRTASLRNPFAPIQSGSTTSPGLTAVSCSSWAGQGISTVACNPKELRRAVLTGHIGGDNGMTLSVSGEHGISASGHGITQYTGQGILHSGAQLSIAGPVTNETEVLVHTYDPAHKHLLLARFDLAMPNSGAHIARMAHQALRLRVARSRAGHIILSLGKFHAQEVSVMR